MKIAKFPLIISVFLVFNLFFLVIPSETFALESQTIVSKTNMKILGSRPDRKGPDSMGPGGSRRNSDNNSSTKTTNLSFSSGAAAEKYLHKQLGGKREVTLKTTKKLGKRRVDVLVKKKNANESKVGYASKSSFIKKQVDKDAWLLKNDKVNSVTWHFFRSSKTDKIGPSEPLKAYLQKKKIKIKYHYTDESK